MLKVLGVPLIPSGIWKEFLFPVKSMGKSLHFEQSLSKQESCLSRSQRFFQKVSFEPHTWLWMCGQKTCFCFVKTTMLPWLQTALPSLTLKKPHSSFTSVFPPMCWFRSMKLQDKDKLSAQEKGVSGCLAPHKTRLRAESLEMGGS